LTGLKARQSENDEKSPEGVSLVGRFSSAVNAAATSSLSCGGRLVILFIVTIVVVVVVIGGDGDEGREWERVRGAMVFLGGFEDGWNLFSDIVVI